MSLQYEVLHENVYYFPSIVKNIDFLLEQIETFNSVSISDWETWYAKNTPDSYPYGDVKTFRTSLIKNEVDLEKKKTAEKIIFTILDALEQSCREFLINHGAEQDELDYLKYTIYNNEFVYGIRKYNPNEQMGPHQDQVSEDRDTITISMYLNDDYEGGEISVVEPGVDVTIKTLPGSIVIFPSSYLHESKQLVSGRKTILTHVHMALGKIVK